VIATCPFCQRKLAVSERLLGTVSACRACGGKILLPGAEGGEAKPVQMPPLPKSAPVPGKSGAASPSSTALDLPNPESPVSVAPVRPPAAAPEPDNLSSQALAVPAPPPPEPQEDTPSPAAGIGVAAPPPWRALPQEALARPLPNARPGISTTPFGKPDPAGSAFLPSPVVGAPVGSKVPAAVLKGIILASLGIVVVLVARHFIGAAATDALKRDAVLFNDAVVRSDSELVNEAAAFSKVLYKCVDGGASIDDLGPRLAAIHKAIGKAEAEHRAMKPPPGPKARQLAEAAKALLVVERRIWFEDVPKLILALQMADAAARQKLLTEATQSLGRAEEEALRKRSAVKAAQKAFAEESGLSLVPSGP
jgi:hypothetical protein